MKILLMPALAKKPAFESCKNLDFVKLHEEVKYEAEFYDKDIILYWQKCERHRIIEGDKETSGLFLLPTFIGFLLC